MVYFYVNIAASMVALGACLDCIVIMAGYVVRSIFRMITKGGG